MSFSDQLLTALSLYGLPVLFGVTIIASIGFPLPMSLMLVAAGSFVEQGEMKLWHVILLTSLGAVIGDNIGYWLGRWGGHRLAKRVSRWVGGEEKLQEAEAKVRRWGGWGIFLTRWLFTPLGPAFNLTSGIAEYSWSRFLFFDIIGELLWVVIYVLAGKYFSDRVQAMSEVLGDLTWVLLGLAAAILLGWKLLHNFRSSRRKKMQIEVVKSD